jgi:hypothetical protein
VHARVALDGMWLIAPLAPGTGPWPVSQVPMSSRSERAGRGFIGA